MPRCPHCHADLTDAEVRALWASRNSIRRANPSGGRNGGRPLSCACGHCPTCIRRAKRAGKQTGD